MSDAAAPKETSSELVEALYAELRHVARRERWQILSNIGFVVR